MDLYHGSDHMIAAPAYGLGSARNDYGRGFYCTEHPELAKEWACGTGSDGYANHYSFDPEVLSVLDLGSGEYSILTWLALLAKNRTYWERSSISESAKTYLQEHFSIDTSHYDVIRGYRADDSYFSFARDFVSNAISFRTLTRAMRLGELGEQIVIKSPIAFSHLQYIDSEPAFSSKYYLQRQERDRAARAAYRRLKASDGLQDIYMIDIMREGINRDDPRLR